MFRCPSCHRRREGAAPCPLDGWSPPHEDGRVAPPPPRLQGAKLGELLGQGGFASVWAGEREDRSAVAVKVALTTTPMLEERFRREAEALRLVGPPHAPALHDHGHLDDGRPYLVMERLVGRTLASELASLATPPDPGWAAARADAILAALEAAHARGVLHRDLKPENLFIAPGEERLVLLDFGLTRRAGRTPMDDAALEALLTRSGAVVGTPEYMAPEQIRGEPVDERADLYAFGVVLFELLTLDLPFFGDASAAQHGHLALRPPRPSDFAPVPPALEELTLACLAKDPGRRPASARELRRLLAEARAAAPASVERPPASTPSPYGDEAPLGAPPNPAPESTRAPRLGLHAGARLIAEGRLPVVLLVAETRAAAAPVSAAVTGRKGFVSRQRGSRYVAVFSGKDADDPVQAALAAARELVDRYDARAALHLASVTVRRRERGAPSAYGAAVERPETWMPAEPWSGIALTAELERALPTDDTGPISVRNHASVEHEAPLAGRDDVIAAFTESAEAAFDGTCPGLFTLLGEHGLGKSRLAAEAASVARLRRPDALVISLRASQPLPGEPARETAELLRRIEGAPGLSFGPPDRLAAPASPAPADVVVAMARHGLVRELAEGLRRRARRSPVAVILDDAQWADDALVDALEVATLDGDGVALWAVVIALPRFEQVRRAWGARTQRHVRATLAPLDDASAMALAAQLLLPAEYPPGETLRRLAAWAGGNPACISELVRSLKRAGIVRRRPNADSYYVATAELDNLPPSPAWQWLATRQLDALPPEVAACVRLCAVLGVSFGRAELESVQDAIERAGGAGTPVDAGYGLDALIDRGILKRVAGDRYAFQSAVFQDAVYELLDPAQREQIHAHAFAFFRRRAEELGTKPEALAPLARHAAASGARDEAAATYLRLGDIALAQHRHVEADQHYTSCLGLAAEGEARLRALSLLGRGKSRYSVHRPREATDDFAAARALARELGDDAFLVAVLLEEATALDWANDFDTSAERVRLARSLARPLDAPELEARLLVAEGRTCVRQGRMGDAVELLRRGAATAEAAHDYAAQVVAVVLLSGALVFAGRVDEAEATFEQGIALATEAQDWMHLCAVYVNRAFLWATKHELSLAIDDMRRTLALAREVGNPIFERVATHNIAELLFANDQADEALPLARRALVLEQRFVDKPVPEASLLLARILSARGEFDEASRLMGWIAEKCAPDTSASSLSAFYRMLELVLDQLGLRPRGEGAPKGSWPELLSDAQNGLLPFELLEILHWRAVAAIERGEWRALTDALAQAEAPLSRCPMWRSRFDGLRRHLPAVQAPSSTD